MRSFSTLRNYLLYQFWNKIYLPFDATDEDCWEWTACTNGVGYGLIRLTYPRRCIKLATHVSWFLYRGYWPKNFILHKCDCPSCVNPSHLFEGTAKDNTQDMIQKGRDKVMGRGMLNHRARLTDEDIPRIREMVDGGKMSLREIAKIFKVSIKSVNNVGLRKTWNRI